MWRSTRRFWRCLIPMWTRTTHTANWRNLARPRTSIWSLLPHQHLTFCVQSECGVSRASATTELENKKGSRLHVCNILYMLSSSQRTIKFPLSEHRVFLNAQLCSCRCVRNMHSLFTQKVKCGKGQRRFALVQLLSCPRNKSTKMNKHHSGNSTDF